MHHISTESLNKQLTKMKGSLNSTMDSDESTVIMGAEETSNREDSPSPPAIPLPPTAAEKLAELLEKAKFYTSLCLGTTAILAVFAFLFLIPFVVEPAITTILADFESEAVTCAVSDHMYVEGMKNCSWASCREGCTTAHTRCYQILVNYSKIPFSEFQQSGLTVNTIDWDVTDTHYLINTEGCGYPPRVNCTNFARDMRDLFDTSTAFPCYYSKVHPERVVERYNWPTTLQHLAVALIAPPVIFVVTVGILAYWHCSCGSDRGSMERFPPNKEDKLLCEELDLDDPEESLYIRDRVGSRDTDALWKG